MMDQASQKPHPELGDVPLGERIETIADALAGRVSQIITLAPPEPCMERDFCNVPLPEWRRAIDEWCRDGFVRRAHGFETAEGLRLAVQDFDDDTFCLFLESLV